MIATRVLVWLCSALLAAQAAAPQYDIVLHGGRVLDPASGLDAIRNIGITGKKIAALLRCTMCSGTPATAASVTTSWIDATTFPPRM